MRRKILAGLLTAGMIINLCPAGMGTIEAKAEAVKTAEDAGSAERVKNICLGVLHSAAVMENGDLYCWGDNDSGEVGNGSKKDQLTPVKVLEGVKEVSLGFEYSAAVMENGDLYCWGYNRYGEVGNGRTGDQRTPVKVLEGVKEVSLGCYSSAAITENGDLYCWGWNEYGEVGNGSLEDQHTPVKVLEGVKEVSLGYDNSAAITENGDLYCWGWNEYGEVGNGSLEDQDTPVKVLEGVKEVSLGAWYSAAITENGDLYCWGYNWCGQVGNGSTEDQHTPVKVLEGVKEVSLSSGHSAAITENGDLYCWGWNEYGEVGNGSLEDQHTPVKVLEGVKEVSLGCYSSAAVTENGDLYCWGDNGWGQVGNGRTEDQHTPVKVLEGVREVSLGHYHSAAVTENGDLYCWGYNEYGQVGNGSTEDRLTPVKVLGSGMMPESGSSAEEDLFKTSTDGVCDANSIAALLENPDYSSYVSSVRSIDMIIPGLKQTNMGNKTVCGNMVPQGVCATNHYILISAYCKDKEHNSVIYVMDKSRKKYITTILLSVEDHAGLKDGNHVGGLAFGNNTVYIAGSGDNKVWKLPYRTVSYAVSSGKDAYAATISKNDYIRTGNASFIYWDESFQELFVGNFDESDASQNFMRSYDVNTGNATSRKIQLPKQTQGVSFGVGKDKRTYCICSKSYGRKNQSEIYAAELIKLGGLFDYRLLNWHKITVPNMSEDIQVLGGTLYHCFESAANCYRSGGEQEQPFDRIPYIGVRSLILSIMNGGELANIKGKFREVKRSAWKGEGEIDDNSGILLEGSCGENVSYCLYDNGEILLSGQGDMEDYSEELAPWDDYKEKITSVYIDRGVTSVGEYAFYNCPNLTEVTASEYMNFNTNFIIGRHAFDNCPMLQKMMLPDVLFDIKEEAFDQSAEIEFDSDSDDIKKYTDSNGNTTLHQHDFRHVKTVKATCMENGYDLYQCECGCEEVKNIVEATSEHSWKEAAREEATETEDGFVKYQCENCIDTYVEILESVPSADIPEMTETPLPPISTEVPSQSVKPNQSAMPVQSVEPNQSAMPVQSVEPNQSAMPVQSVKPNQSAMPVQSVKPNQSAMPVQSVKPNQSAIPVQSVKPVQSPAPSPSVTPSLSTTSKPTYHDDDDNYYSTKPKKPAKVKLKSCKAKGKKTIVVRWKKASKAVGYQVQYALKPNFSHKKQKKVKTLMVKLKKLKSKKTYYIRVRAYNKKNGRTAYGRWSTKKKCRVK